MRYAYHINPEGVITPYEYEYNFHGDELFEEYGEGAYYYKSIVSTIWYMRRHTDIDSFSIKDSELPKSILMMQLLE